MKAPLDSPLGPHPIRCSGDMVHCEEGLTPRRATKDSAGYDFLCPKDVIFEPGVVTRIDSGVRFTGDEQVEIVRGDMHIVTDEWFMMIVPRSGLGMKYGMRWTNTIGIIDHGYRDTIKFDIVVDKHLELKKGDRFAQGILIPFCRFGDEITPTEERKGGLGSTGL